MKRYLELYEITEIGEADFIRVDITEWSEREVEEAVKLLVEHAEESYNSYILQLHNCYHEEGKPCTVSTIRVK